MLFDYFPVCAYLNLFEENLKFLFSDQEKKMILIPLPYFSLLIVF